MSVAHQVNGAPGDSKSHVKIAEGSGGLADGSLANNDELGTSVAMIGDLDGDSIPDLASGP